MRAVQNPRSLPPLASKGRFLFLLVIAVTLCAGSALAQHGKAINGEGYFRIPLSNVYLRYKASASKGVSGDKTAKFLLRLCSTNQHPVSLVVCAMLDLDNGKTVTQPEYVITKGAAGWTCRQRGEVEAIYNYHFGCRQVTVPAAGPGTETNVDVFKEAVTFSIRFEAAQLGTVYMDFLADCPVDASCTNFIGADKMLVPENPALHQQFWVNTWVGGEYFRVQPIPPNLMFAQNPVRVPSGNWVTMGYAADYPARVIGTLRGAPAGSQAVFSFNGQARPAHVVADNPGGQTVLTVNEAFTIPAGIAYDLINLITPAAYANWVMPGATVTFHGEVRAEAGAPHYAPGDLMYHWDIAWVHDPLPPLLLYDSVTQFGDTVQVQVEARDAASLPMEATFVYHSPETGEKSLPIQFSDPATQGDIVHFLSYVQGMPYGIPLDYHIKVHDVFGNVATTPEDSLYLFGARLALAREAAQVIVSWTTSEPGMLLTFNPRLDGKRPWNQVDGAPTIQNGVYSMVLPVGNFPRFFQLQGGLDSPCPGGELLVRQAYSECNADGFWHVVEDNYYACPPSGEVRRFRVADTKTDQPCGAGQAAPAVAGNLYRQLEGDEDCIAPKPVGDIRIVECVDGVWEIATHYLYECLDGSRRICIPGRARVRTTRPCTQPPPAPLT